MHISHFILKGCLKNTALKKKAQTPRHSSVVCFASNWLTYSIVATHSYLHNDSHCPQWSEVCRRAVCRTRSPHFQQCPASPSWHFSPAVPAVVCSRSDTCCSSGGGAEQNQHAGRVKFMTDKSQAEIWCEKGSVSDGHQPVIKALLIVSDVYIWYEMQTLFVINLSVSSMFC